MVGPYMCNRTILIPSKIATDKKQENKSGRTFIKINIFRESI